MSMQENEIVELIDVLSDYFQQEMINNTKFTIEDVLYVWSRVVANKETTEDFEEDFLIQARKYFDKRSDADYEQNDIDGHHVPNEEMKLLSQIDEVLDKIKK